MQRQPYNYRQNVLVLDYCNITSYRILNNNCSDRYADHAPTAAVHTTFVLSAIFNDQNRRYALLQILLGVKSSGHLIS